MIFLLFIRGNIKKNDRKLLCTAPQAGKSRTIYLGGLPEGCENWDVHHQIFDQIRGAPVEALRLIPAKQCAFIDFCDEAGAMAFADRWDKGPKKFTVKDKEVKVAWASSTNLSTNVLTAIRNGATRNVYLNNIEVEDSEESVMEKRGELERVFKQFGPVDMVRVVHERKIAFVHMASVSAAMEAVNVLSAKSDWKGHRINFGSDRCGDRPPPGVHPTIQAAVVNKRRHDDDYAEEEQFSRRPTEERLPYRTVYIGGMTKEISLEDLCDVIRGGLIQSIRLAPEEKHCAFVTFVDEPSAITFYDFFSVHGFVVKGVPLKLGWSKPSAVPVSIVQALQKGATRNIYIGNIVLDALGPDPSSYLSKDCSTRFGPVEAVNVITAKNIAFVTFCNLLDAVKALAGLRDSPEYAQCKVAYGQDRCAHLPKPSLFAPPPPPPMPYYPSSSSTSYVHPSLFATHPHIPPHHIQSYPPPPLYYSSPPSSYHHPPPHNLPYHPMAYYPAPPGPVHYVPVMPIPYIMHPSPPPQPVKPEVEIDISLEKPIIDDN